MTFDWIDDIESMLIAVTSAGKIVAVNRQLCRVLRYASTETCGLDLRKLLVDPSGTIDNFIGGSPTMESPVSARNIWLTDTNGKKWPAKATVVRTEGRSSAKWLVFCRIQSGTNVFPGDVEMGFRDFQIKTLGRMTEGLVYDFRNIFGIITGYTEMVRERLPGDDELTNDLAEVLAACARGKRLLNNINAFCKTTKAGNVSLDVGRSFEVMMEKLKSSLPPKTTLEYSSSVKKASISVDLVKFEQLLIGICLALCDYGKMNLSLGDISISIAIDYRMLDDSVPSEIPVEQKFVQILIQSDALRLDRNSVERFNRLNRHSYCKSNELCSVLETCRRILIDLNGQMLLDYCADRPAISILFPLVDKCGTGKPVYTRPPHGKGQCVLVVDDEIQVADLTARRLEKIGYKVVKRTNSMDALDYFFKNSRMFSLLIIDQVMPHLSGLEFAQEVKKINPEIPIVMMTGYSSGITEKICDECGIKSLVMKPIDEKELAAIVAIALS